VKLYVLMLLLLAITLYADVAFRWSRPRAD
jgi:hypothetical protein